MISTKSTKRSLDQQSAPPTKRARLDHVLAPSTDIEAIPTQSTDIDAVPAQSSDVEALIDDEYLTKDPGQRLLTALFEALEKAKRDHGDRLSFISNWLTPDNVAAARQALQRGGLAIINDVVDATHVTAVERLIGRYMCDTFDGELNWPDDVRTRVQQGDIAAANRYRTSATGFALRGFGFLHRWVKPKGPSVQLDNNERVQLTSHTLHASVTILDGWAPQKAISSVLVLAPDVQRPMIGVDSVKVGTSPSGKRNKNLSKEHTSTAWTTTMPHCDKHLGAAPYRQAMINFDGRVKLVFVPLTAVPAVRQALNALTTQLGLRSMRSNTKLLRPVLQLLDRYAVVPPPGALVVWGNLVVHYEAMVTKNDPTVLEKRNPRADWKPWKQEKRFRICCPLIEPTGLSDRVLQQLAVLAENGAVPAYCYKSGGRAPNATLAPTVNQNMICQSSTREDPACEQTPVEVQKLQAAITALETGEQQTWQALSPLRKHLYGVPQPLNELGFDDAYFKVLTAAAAAAVAEKETLQQQ